MFNYYTIILSFLKFKRALTRGYLVLRIFLWGVLQKVYIVGRVERERKPTYTEINRCENNCQKIEN